MARLCFKSSLGDTVSLTIKTELNEAIAKVNGVDIMKFFKGKKKETIEISVEKPNQDYIEFKKELVKLINKYAINTEIDTE